VENLLDNAIRHSPAGGEVRVANGGGDGRVWVRVEDDGPGFRPEVLPVAFEPFSGASANGDGAGLGLAIVGAVAASHGGTATAENLAGGGARVTITLRA
jgi:signal transduction histidine kinase